MANGEGNIKDVDEVVNNNLKGIDPLDEINQMIDDMQQAELNALNEGLKPWEYNLSAKTMQVSEDRKKQEQLQREEIAPTISKSLEERTEEIAKEISGKMPGDWNSEEVMGKARRYAKKEKMLQKHLYEPAKEEMRREGEVTEAEELPGENKYLLNQAPGSPTFDLGGERYNFIEGDDAVARMVKYDDEGILASDSPVVPVGKDNKGKILYIAKEGVKGVNPSQFNMSIISSSKEKGEIQPEYRWSAPQIRGATDKASRMIYNKFNDIDSVIDPETSKQVYQFQQTGVLR